MIGMGNLNRWRDSAQHAPPSLRWRLFVAGRPQKVHRRRAQTNEHCASNAQPVRIRIFASMSPIGPSRHFAATQQFGRFGSEADIQRAAIAEPDL
jgi:hypothetical protein